MKNSIIIPAVTVIAVSLLFFGLQKISNEQQETKKEAEKNEQSITSKNTVAVSPIEHSSAVIVLASTTIYVDPLLGGDAYSTYPEAELVVVTDIHGDHFNLSTLEYVVGEGTVLIVPKAVADLLPTTLSSKAVVLANGEKTEKKGIHIEAVPMYNLPERADEAHTKGRGNGYVLEKDGTRVYIAGDTDGTPEMLALTDIDVALIPMNPPYTMSVEEAVDAVLAFNPKLVYPYHYRGVSGLSDVQKFKQLVEEGNSAIEVVLLNWYPNTTMSSASDVQQGETDDMSETTKEDAVPEQESTPANVKVEVAGTNFAFDVKEISVKKGDTVTIVFTNNEGFHDWVIDEFDAQTKQITQGQTAEVSFVADKAGTFEYYCSVGNHRAQGMVGTLIVE